jgi:predicted DNA-binding ribbon-helix-helix protein
MSTARTTDPFRLHKRSLAIAGHNTSIALEPEFWAVLDSLAKADGQPLTALIAAIDADRAARSPERALASALRVYALAQACAGRLKA